MRSPRTKTRKQTTEPMNNALVIVDPLADFCPGGSLPAPGGDQIMPRINELMRTGGYPMVVLVQEEHPPDHISFASRHGLEPFREITLDDGRRQMLWPDHCIRGTAGAQPHRALARDRVTHVVKKGGRSETESYSGFEDEDGRETGLTDLLNAYNVRHIDVCGIATDYCVRATVLDARAPRRDLDTRVLLDACAGIDASDGDVDRAINEMRRAGAEIIDHAQS